MGLKSTIDPDRSKLPHRVNVPERVFELPVVRGVRELALLQQVRRLREGAHATPGTTKRCKLRQESCFSRIMVSKTPLGLIKGRKMSKTKCRKQNVENKTLKTKRRNQNGEIKMANTKWPEKNGENKTSKTKCRKTVTGSTPEGAHAIPRTAKRRKLYSESYFHNKQKMSVFVSKVFFFVIKSHGLFGKKKCNYDTGDNRDVSIKS